MSHLLNLVVGPGELVLDVLRCTRAIRRGESVFNFDELLLVLVLLLAHVQGNSLTSQVEVC